jgi:hypothetical protein
MRWSPRRRVASYLRLAAVARHVAAGPTEVVTPGFIPLDAGTIWHATSHLEVRAIGRNLLDRQWYSNAGPRWVYAPGRSASITGVVAF